MKKIVVSILIIMEGIFLFLSYKSFINIPKENEVEEIKIVEDEEIPSNGFAYLIENNSGGFDESADRTKWPDANYIFSGVDCYDETGPVTNANVTFNESSHQFTVKTKDSLFCYLKFAKKTSAYGALVANSKGQLEEETNRTARGDNILRYQGQAGTVTNNYICLGSITDCDLTKETNSDKYSYRIIGIVREANTATGEQVGQIKVIKTEALNTQYAWNSSTGDTYTWDNSELNTGINGAYFLTNATYGLTENNMIGSTGKSWSGLIAAHTWKYSYVPYSSSTGIYITTSGADVYKKEKELWSSGTQQGQSTKKVGLMYVHDYILATQDGNNKKCVTSSSSDYTTCKGNWVYLWNTNDSGAPNNSYEWTMSRNNSSVAWYVGNNGRVDYEIYNLAISFSVRPVFYLQSTVQLSGRGTNQSPYIVTSY